MTGICLCYLGTELNDEASPSSDAVIYKRLFDPINLSGPSTRNWCFNHLNPNCRHSLRPSDQSPKRNRDSFCQAESRLEGR